MFSVWIGGVIMADNFYKAGEENDIPNTSNYMKFQDGDNRFRILGSFAEGTAIQGIQYWKTVEGTRKPVRIHRNDSVPMEELEINKFGEQDTPKFFWALPVWNYEEKRVQILEITQKTVLNFIKKQIDNPKWGNPRNYDFIVTKEKQGEKTVYTVTNDPKEDLDKTILKQYEDTSIDINKLFLGEDPFAGGKSADEISTDDVPSL